MTNAILRGKPDAGNPHVRFDEGEVASAKPRRGSLLYKVLSFAILLAAFVFSPVAVRAGVWHVATPCVLGTAEVVLAPGRIDAPDTNNGWSCEVFIPFAGLKAFPGLQLPEGTAAAGKYWIGNFCRFRALRKGEKDGCHTNPNGILSFSRRYTRGRDWNTDSSAFGKLQFKE